MKTSNDPHPTTPHHPRRRRSRRRLLGLLALAATLAIGATALARPGHGHGHGGLPGMMMMRVLGKLELTEAQELEAIRLRRAVAEEGRATRAAMHGAMGEAITELGKAQPDARKLHGAIDEVTAKLTRSLHGAVDGFLKLHATLSPAQRQELAGTLGKHHARAAKRLEERDGDD